MTLDAAGIYLDYSKNRITDETLRAARCGSPKSPGCASASTRCSAARRSTSPSTARCCTSRCARRRGASIVVDGEDVVPEVHAVLDKMAEFSRRACAAARGRGHTGKRIVNVINVGIGGSDLGPVMAYEALKHYSDRGMTFRFVSNVDGTDFAEAVRDLDPAETLFIISSKTFTTLETMTNAHTRARVVAGGPRRRRSRRRQALRRRLDQRRRGGEVRHRHRQHVRVLGLGRRPLLDGLGDRALDDARHRPRELPRHARPASTKWTNTSAPRRSNANLPVLMGLLAVWYNDFFGAQTVGRAALRAIPQALSGLPAATHDGEQRQARHARRRAGRASTTGPIYWGEPGTNGQHSFYQLIHQGTRLIPCDFIGFAQALNPLGEHHDMLLANVFAQGEALAFGKTPRRGESRRHRPTGSCRIASSRATGRRTRCLLERLDARRARQARRALRAQRVHAGRDLAHRFVRSVGRRTRQGARPAHHSRTRRRRANPRSTTTARPTRSSAATAALKSRRRRTTCNSE